MAVKTEAVAPNRQIACENPLDIVHCPSNGSITALEAILLYRD